MLIRNTEKEARTLYTRAILGFVACCMMAGTLMVCIATWRLQPPGWLAIVVAMNATWLILEGRFVVEILRRGSRV